MAENPWREPPLGTTRIDGGYWADRRAVNADDGVGGLRGQGNGGSQHDREVGD